ncbi:uncharacterized protein LOC124708695 [Lolium rigidum]|uniref:uncharacterized protein LOC124708695 n=1 Tax=Lolium rigidum TaxID=89674 RepID=UPI001F5DDD36|nr:uncharacterized protein LOC124708695 [Lolium rigidum]
MAAATAGCSWWGTERREQPEGSVLAGREMSLTPTLASQGNTSAERKQDCGQEEQHAVLKDENKQVMQTGRCPDRKGRDKLNYGDKQVPVGNGGGWRSMRLLWWRSLVGVDTCLSIHQAPTGDGFS